MREKVLIGCRVKLKGINNEIEGYVIVDTGSIYTIIDKNLANFLGVEYYGTKLKVLTLRCEIEGELASIKFLEIEGRVIGSVNVVVTKIPEELKKILKVQGFRDDVILSASDAKGFVIDLNERRLKWVGLIAV